MALLGWLLLALNSGLVPAGQLQDLFEGLSAAIAGSGGAAGPIAGPGPPPPPPLLQLPPISGSPTAAQASSSAARHLGDDSASSSSSDSADDHSAGHDTDAMLFLFNAIVAGALLAYLTFFKTFQNLQHTVALFVIGIVYSVVLEGFGLHSSLGIFGRSFKMWMDIDPHLLLYTMLPALLTSDAMTIDTNVAKRVMSQCIYLAGPGVLINAFLTAAFLWVYLPYDWSFMLSLTTGAILCATDPVAVVALLKELGASPTLTVQIQGESLLNDGTAIVLFTIAYNMLQDITYDASDVIIYLLKTAMCAWVLGLGIGGTFLVLIRLCSSRLEHSSSLVQTVLTLSCAYWSFVVAEGVFHMSGVLSCVAASLVLAHKMWPAIVDKESLQAFWHAFEFIGNSVVFFLAGSLTGVSMVHIGFKDYVHLIVIYIVVVGIRLGLLFASKPILKRLHPERKPPSNADLLVMTWGGLRGAVGVALAIQVAISKAGGRVSDPDAQRVLFYVSGVAALTLIVNATTSPRLVRALGITCWPQAKCQLLRLLHAQLRYKASERPHTSPVTRTINSVLDDVLHHIEEQAHKRASRSSVPSFTPVLNMGLGGGGQESGPPPTPSRSSSRVSQRMSIKLNSFMGTATNGLQPGLDLADSVKTAKASVTAIKWLQTGNREFSRILKNFPEIPFKGQEDGLMDIVQSESVEPGLMRMFNEAYLQLVRTQYWHQIEAGLLPGVRDAELLLLSITLAQSQPTYDLCDFGVVCQLMDQGKQTDKDKAKQKPPRAGKMGMLHTLLESLAFNSFMMICIVGSAIVTQLEDSIAGHDRSFYVLEIVFLSIFTMEFLLKLVCKRLTYFKEWGLFDFTLIVLGVFGLILTTFVEADLEAEAAVKNAEESSDLGNQGRLLRIARVFRVLRLVRVVQLYRLYLAVRSVLKHQNLSLELADHLHFIAVLTGFVRAHVGAQKDLVKFFCRDGQISQAEIARNILQSQVSCYQAITRAVRAEQALDKKAMKGVMALRESMDVMMELESLVLGCHKAGILDGRDTESILHPMHMHMKQFCKTISLAYEGVTGEWDDIHDFTKHSESEGRRGTASSSARYTRVLTRGLSRLPGSSFFKKSQRSTESSSVDFSDEIHKSDSMLYETAGSILNMLGTRRNSNPQDSLREIRPLTPLSEKELTKVRPYVDRLLRGFRERHPEFACPEFSCPQTVEEEEERRPPPLHADSMRSDDFSPVVPINGVADPLPPLPPLPHLPPVLDAAGSSGSGGGGGSVGSGGAAGAQKPRRLLE